MPEDRLIVGRILAAWGLRGEVAVEVISTNPARFARGNTVYAAGAPLTVEQVRRVSGRVVITFRELSTRDQADALRGVMLDIPAAGVPPLEPGQYYHHQLLGLSARTREGRELGAITEILTTGANDVYVASDGKREYLLPAIAEVILSIDLERGEMIVDPLPGLFD